MGHELEISFEGNYVQIISRGDKSYDTSVTLWDKATKVCKKHNCYKVLGIASSSSPPSTIDAYKHAELLHEFEIDYRYKIAWVEFVPQSLEGMQFLENVLFNRGMNVKLFTDIETAKKWLLEEIYP